MTSIATKIYESCRGEDGPFDALIREGKYPAEAIAEDRGVCPAESGDAHDRESFAMYLGAAYVLARIESPWASPEDWVNSAKEAAIEASRWRDSLAGRPEGES